MNENTSTDNTLGLTAQIVTAHVAHNSVGSDELPALIQAVYRALTEVGKAPTGPAKPEPAVSVRKSVFPDYIVCLEDGKKLKMLKRHLMATYSMTPEQYRERWGLPQTYPMVAPNYAEIRSSLAKKIGLGRRRTGKAAKPRSVQRSA